MAWLTAAQLRAFDDGLASVDVYGDAQLTAVISDVEAEIERIVGLSYNSRTATNEWHLGPGSEWLRLDNLWPTSVSAASIDGVALSASELTGLVIDRQAGRVRYTGSWPLESVVLITYAYGKTAPPADLLRAAKLLCRARLADTRSPVMERASQYQPDGSGGMIRLDTPTATRTGIPAVDAVLARYWTPGVA